MKAVILLSGGLDSCVAASQALANGYDLLAISIGYGQKHEIRERAAALAIVERLSVDYPHLKIEHEDGIPMADIFFANDRMAASSALLGGGEIPEGHYEADSMKATVVPNRNMIFLSIATAFAIAENAAMVIYAAHAGDHAIYPDCRPEFAGAMSQAIAAVSETKCYLSAPFIKLTKSEIVAIGHELNAPMELSWSCYKGDEVHCGKCGTCVERVEAFQLAGIIDPTKYEYRGFE